MDIRRSLILSIIVVLAFFASAGQTPTTGKITGPEFDILQKVDGQHSDDKYCHGYFMREPSTQYAPNGYLYFYYRDKDGQVAHDEALIKNLTVVVTTPKETDKEPASTVPKARMVSTERGQTIWDLVMTEAVRQENSDCLKDIKIRNEP